MNKAERERRMAFARQEAAKAWGKKKTSDKIMDSVLAEEFAKILVKHMYEPHLGCAKTSTMSSEIKTRCGREEATIDCN
jgi:hypothetical protein